MNKDTDKMQWVQEGRSDELIWSLYRTTTAALGSFSSVSDYEVWKKAGVGVCSSRTGRRRKTMPFPACSWLRETCSGDGSGVGDDHIGVAWPFRQGGKGRRPIKPG